MYDHCTVPTVSPMVDTWSDDIIEHGEEKILNMIKRKNIKITALDMKSEKD